jgi:hypothetical protein
MSEAFQLNIVVDIRRGRRGIPQIGATYGLQKASPKGARGMRSTTQPPSAGVLGVRVNAALVRPSPA